MKCGALLALLPGLLLGLSACEKPAEQTAASGQTKTAAQAGLEPAQVERGRLVYMKNCQTCHGLDGKGQPGDWRVRKANGLYPPPPLDDTAHAWHHPTAVLRKAILEGSPPDMGDMPPWKDKLLGEEIDDVIVYIKSLWSDEVYRHWLEIERNALEN
jgi:mono/diheme cytochrome c family protein